MMWLIYIAGYLAVATVVGLWYGRSEAKELIAQPNKFRYVDENSRNYWDDSPRKERTEEERVERCIEAVFWESWWTGVLWPFYFIYVVIVVGYKGVLWTIAGGELKKARAIDTEKKAKEIIKKFEEEEKKKFDGL